MIVYWYGSMNIDKLFVDELNFSLCYCDLNSAWFCKAKEQLIA